MVIDKPSGLVVTPSDSHKEVTISEILENEFKLLLDRGGVVHRLDKDTSGVMLVAKTLKALENLQSQFKERTVKKNYLALVHGQLLKTKVVSAPINRHPGNREKFTVLEEGREAETIFNPYQKLTLSDQNLEQIFTGFNKIQFRKLKTTNYQLFTLINCFPQTGRTHQIRVHLKYIGFPIVSDEKYGGRKTVRLDKRWCPRQFLHASKIEFNHPETGVRLEFESALPVDLKQALKKLEIN